MQRSLSIRLLQDTWPEGVVPAGLQGIATQCRDVSVSEALIHTALWTRSPAVKGFELSDLWAWLRHFPALDDGPGLRLRAEWFDLDAHQKTILSDELGIGFTTCILAKHLHLAEFVDTRYVLHALLPGEFEPGGNARQGPKKTPDYLSWSPTGGVVVLECKGTQRSHAVLERAVRDGIAQKENLKQSALGKTQIEHSLVGGLFIPNAQTSEHATLLFADPDWETLRRRFAAEEPRRVHHSILQVFLAKVLALLGETTLAAELVNTPFAAVEESGRRPEWQRAFPAEAIRIVELPVTWRFGHKPVRARFSLQLSDRLRTALGRGNIVDAIEALAQNGEWSRESSGDRGLALRSPHGLRWSLEISEAL